MLEEQKVMSERYILVAAIVTIIIQGVWGICVVEKRNEIDNITSPLVTINDVLGRGALIFSPK
jgi:hypothetical protein